MNRSIVIIGASISQNPLIIKAKEMGYITHVFAWKTGDIGEKNADYFYPISILNIDLIYKECLKIKPVAIVTIASDHCAVVVEELCERLGFRCNKNSVIKNMTNKILFREKMQNHICQPQFVDADNFSDISFPCIVKPSDRTGGRGIKYVLNRKDLIDAIADARDISFERKAIIEKYIDGDEYFCEVYSYNGNHKIIAFTRVIKEGLLHKEYIQPVEFSHEIRDNIEKNIIKILDILEYKNGPSHIEFILSDDFYVIEASPTIGGDSVGSLLTPLSTGFDYLGAIIEGACDNNPLNNTYNGKFNGIFSVKLVNNKEDYKEYEISKNVINDDALNITIDDISNLKKYGSYITKHYVREMGSFLPLELPQTQNPFNNKGIAVNSYKSAILLALQLYGNREVYIPYLYPSSISNFLLDKGYKIVYYHINDLLLPQSIPSNKTVIIMNYFDINNVSEFANNYIGNIIVDNSFSYFSEHIKKTIGVYVCTNYFGVSNGAYVVSDFIINLELKKDVSYDKSSHLLKALEFSTSESYKEYSANEQKNNGEILAMSLLTMKILESLDYEKIKNIRKENYDFLYKHLGGFERKNNVIPQCFPLILGEDVRKKLLDKKIYIPLYFRKNYNEMNDIERNFSMKLVCIPIDQRYSLYEMEYIAKLIRCIK